MHTVISYSEQDLVDLLKDRDDMAFGYLYDNYSGALYSIVLQIVNDKKLANEILQDVYSDIWRNIVTYDHLKGRLFTWMMNIARNASIDALHSKSYPHHKNQVISKNENGNADTDGQSAQLIVDNIGLKKTIEKLKEDHRALIELSYFKGYTHEEISEIEDIPLENVKTLIRNALIQLREYIR